MFRVISLKAFSGNVSGQLLRTRFQEIFPEKFGTLFRTVSETLVRRSVWNYFPEQLRTTFPKQFRFYRQVSPSTSVVTPSKLLPWDLVPWYCVHRVTCYHGNWYHNTLLPSNQRGYMWLTNTMIPCTMVLRCHYTSAVTYGKLLP